MEHGGTEQYEMRCHDCEHSRPAEQCPLNSAKSVSRFPLTAFVGLDGFVDEILHVVTNGRARQIPSLSDHRSNWLRASPPRRAEAPISNSSASSQTRGNGPIMANALASLGCESHLYRKSRLPQLHPVFADFAKRAEVYSIAEPGYTDALEFEDGKIMLGKHQSLRQVNWENSKPGLVSRSSASTSHHDLVGFVIGPCSRQRRLVCVLKCW